MEPHLIVFQIAQVGVDRLHVQLAAATEMSFEVVIAGGDYQQLITDICQVAPAMMRYDADMMEMSDGADVKPALSDRVAIRRFVAAYRTRIKNAQVGLELFAGLDQP